MYFEEADHDTQFTMEALPHPAQSAYARSRYEPHLEDVHRVERKEPGFLEKTRLRVTSWVERMNDEIEKEKDVFSRDDDSSRLNGGSTGLWSGNDFSADLHGKVKKTKDAADTSSIRTADTEKFSDSLSSESSFDMEDEWSKLRDERLRGRFQPFLRSETEERREKSPTSPSNTWTIHVHHEEAHVRFHLTEQEQPAVVVLYDDEIQFAVQNLLSSASDASAMQFELVFGEGEGSLHHLENKKLLTTLSEMVQRSKALELESVVGVLQSTSS